MRLLYVVCFVCFNSKSSPYSGAKLKYVKDKIYEYLYDLVNATCFISKFAGLWFSVKKITTIFFKWRQYWNYVVFRKTSNNWHNDLQDKRFVLAGFSKLFFYLFLTLENTSNPLDMHMWHTLRCELLENDNVNVNQKQLNIKFVLNNSNRIGRYCSTSTSC